MDINQTNQYVESFNRLWKGFAQQIQLNEMQLQTVHQLLSKAYSEPQRAYHTSQHIVECLELFYQVKDHLADPIAVELAIWFHDAVYNPQASDNEKQSAELMQQYCASLFEEKTIRKVYKWIVATKKHQPSDEQDLNYLLDIDLAILGRSKSRFKEYEQQIQQEYSWVASEVYQIKRAEVLQHFYQMQPLYQTEYFRDLLEGNAKLNLSNP